MTPPKDDSPNARGFNMKEAILSSVLTAPNNSWPTFDGKKLKRSNYLSASEAAKCVRSLAFQKHKENNTFQIENYWENMSADQFKLELDKVVPGKSPLGYFARGHHVEAWVVEQLHAVEQSHEHFLYMGEDQRSFYHEDHKISGTPDGVYINTLTNEMWLIEIKSSQVPITQPRYAHLTQVQVNMGLITALNETHDLAEIMGLDEFPVFKGAKLLYIDSGNYIDLQEFDIEYDGGLLYSKMRAKSAALFLEDGTVQVPEKLVPQGLSNSGCHFCEDKMNCRAIEDLKNNAETSKKLRELIDKGTKEPPQMPKFASDMPRSQVIKTLLSYAAFSEDEKKAKKQKEALKAAVAAWVEGQKGMKAEFEDDGKLIKVGLSKSVRTGGLNKAKVEALLLELEKELDDFLNADSDVETLRVTVKDLPE